MTHDSSRASNGPRDLGWYVPVFSSLYENAIIDLHGEREATWALIENNEMPGRDRSFGIFLGSMMGRTA